MRKSIKAIICAASAAVMCAAPTVTTFAGVTANTAITAEAVRYNTSATTDYDGITYGLIGNIGDTKNAEFVALYPDKASKTCKKSTYTIPATVTYKGKAYRVTTIAEAAFKDLTYVKKIDFSNAENLQWFHYEAFSGSGLTNVTLPKNLRAIDGYAFAYCESLRSVGTEKCVQLSSIGLNSFAESGLERISIPVTVKNISQYAFYNCNSLRTVWFSRDGKLTYILHHAFYGTALQEITIPKSVTTIGYEAFENCKNLYKVTFAAGNSECVYIGSKAFSGTRLLSIVNNRPNVLFGTNTGNVVREYKYVFGATDATNKISSVSGSYRTYFKPYVK